MALLVAMHGLSDVDRPVMCARNYAIAALVPTSAALSVPIAIGFGTASVLHFSRDIGTVWSVALHAAVALTWWVGSMGVAAGVMTAYLAMVHTPLHILRCLRHGRYTAVVLVFIATACLPLPTTPTFALTEDLQKLVIAHIMTDR